MLRGPALGGSPQLRQNYFLPSTGNRFSTNGNSFGPAHPSHSRVTDFSLMSMTRNLNGLVPSLTRPDSPFVNLRSLIRATRRSAVPVTPFRNISGRGAAVAVVTGFTTRFGKNGSLPAR